MAVKKKSETISTLPLSVISVLLAVLVLIMLACGVVRRSSRRSVAERSQYDAIEEE
jgi:ABC-type Fe3+ transport system permease subunit